MIKDKEHDRYAPMPSHHPNYAPMPSHHPDQRWMVWDWEDNTAVAYCYEEAHAYRVAIALNKEN